LSYDLEKATMTMCGTLLAQPEQRGHAGGVGKVAAAQAE
jgi:hypothetical protein